MTLPSHSTRAEIYRSSGPRAQAMDCPGTLGVYLLHGRGYQGLPFPCKGMDSTQFSECLEWG